MYTSNLSMGVTIPQGIAQNNTLGAFTRGYFFKTMKKMSQFDARQLLLMKIRDDHCGGSATELARRIDKDASYVHRLFYPIEKKGRKGIGLEIMNTCSSEFKLPAGYWEGVPLTNTVYNQEQFPTAILQDDKVTSMRAWPFKDVSEWQYNQLSGPQKQDVEKYVKLQLSTKDPTLEQNTPAYIAKTGTH
jgi:hypothetical protein